MDGELHHKVCASIGLRWASLQPLLATARSLWFHTLTTREQECVAFWQAKQHKNLETLKLLAATPAQAPVHCIDIGQSIDRLPTSSRLEGEQALAEVYVAPTLLPGSQIWLAGSQESSEDRIQRGASKFERLMIAHEACLLQGFPVDRFPALTGFSDGAIGRPEWQQF